MFARLLIDGYNLLHASSVFVSSGPPTLQRTREAFLQTLAGLLSQKQRGRTTVVFDATQAPPGLPHETSFAEMQVLFSRHGQDADALLEDLIAAERAPRETLVVSSDHRVQRAARQRGAKHVDSEVWLRELQLAKTREAANESENSPGAPAADVQNWLAEFGDVDSRQLEPPNVPSNKNAPKIEPAPPPTKRHPPTAPPPRARSTGEKPTGNFENPFPPGYGEDVTEP